jgi:putative addiction module antidote
MRVSAYLSVSDGYTRSRKGVTVPVKFKIKVGKVGNSLRVVIPREIAEHVGLKKGDTIEMWADDGHVIIEKGSKTAERSRK